MKMTKEQYQQLKDDVNAVALHCRLSRRPNTSMAVLWMIVHEINAQRSYSDDHPRWQKIGRVLPASHVKTKSWISDLYDSGLSDLHIKTALQRIASEWHWN
jgi:hypothetical protein